MIQEGCIPTNWIHEDDLIGRADKVLASKFVPCPVLRDETCSSH